MKGLLFLLCASSFFAACTCAITPYHGNFGTREKPLLKDFEGFKYKVNRGRDGVYEFSYHVGDSSRKEERTASGLVKGEYAFVAPEGQEYDFKYEADKNGYRVEGDALPANPEETDEVKHAKEMFLKEYEKALERAGKDGEEGEGGEGEGEGEGEGGEEGEGEEEEEEEEEEEDEEESEEDDEDEEDDEESSEESSEEVDTAKYAIYARYGFSTKNLPEEESSEEDDEEEEEEEEEEGGEGEEVEAEAEKEAEPESKSKKENEKEKSKKVEKVDKVEKSVRKGKQDETKKGKTTQQSQSNYHPAVYAHFGRRIPAPAREAIFIRKTK